MKKITKMQLPTCEEWDQLADIAHEDDSIMHWREMYTWCQNEDRDLQQLWVARGFRSAWIWDCRASFARGVTLGFRPAFDIEDITSVGPDGTIVTAGTLYMGGEPVKVPQSPTWHGDVQKYIPGAKLEMREALDDPAYQVQAIVVGNVLIADRVLLNTISWDDLHEQGFCW